MMETPNQHPKKWWDHFAGMVNIQTTDSDVERKGKILALYIMLLFGIVVYILINNLYVIAVYSPPEYNLYLIQDIITFIPLLLFWKLNQKGYVTLTAYSAVLFSILAAVLGSETKFMEYLMVVFALPIGISSFVIKPSSSVFFALLTAIAYTTSSILEGYIWEYNLTAIIALFSLAIMTWSIAHQLEQTQQKNDALVRTLRRSNRDIKDAYETTLEGWSHALEIRDHETEGHTQRVTDFTTRIAIKMGFSEEQLIQIHRGALLHDIGKLGIPDVILHKPGPLTDAEMATMRTHTQIAYNLLYPIEYLRPALTIPTYHHEKWDGTGYPHGTKGNDIPLEARIFAVIDVYDALSYDRPYRKAWTKEKVIEYIKSESGKHFDPDVVKIFLQEIIKDGN
ncbi:MAG: HD domain-containing protein [Anaerolineales bacterium]|nr:HD domain-containing protein [Anaerolineales bacterium]